MRRFALLLTALCLPLSTPAEVRDAAENGFTVVHEMTVVASRTDAWRAAVGSIGQWWSSDHTVGGDAQRLSIGAVAQGCFCEDLGSGAAVVHMTVTMVNPGVILRLTGGLGPLGLLGVDGNMTWEFEDLEPLGTRIRLTYAVGGYRPGGLDEFAGPVDFVLGEALTRLGRYIETGDPESANID